MGKKADIQHFVGRKIDYLTALSDQGGGKAELALLRRGLGKIPGEIPEVLGILLTDMPEDFLSKGSKTTREEWACYLALTLYALHQQGNDPKISPMHTENRCSIGSALSSLAESYEDANAKQRLTVKLQTLATSKDMSELSYHLRSVVKLLKTKNIPLNYAQLAGDLYLYQDTTARSGVFLIWAQDFYRYTKKADKKEEEK